MISPAAPDRPVGAGRRLPCVFVRVLMRTSWMDVGRCLGYLISGNPDHQVWLESSLQNQRGDGSHAWPAHMLRLLSISLRALLIGHLQLPNTLLLTHQCHAFISHSGVSTYASILLARCCIFPGSFRRSLKKITDISSLLCLLTMETALHQNMPKNGAISV